MNQVKHTALKPLTITPARRALLQHVADGHVRYYGLIRCSELKQPGQKPRTVNSAISTLENAGLVVKVLDNYRAYNYVLTSAGRAALNSAPAAASTA